MVVRVIAIFLATFGIVAFLGEGTAGTGIDTGTAAFAKVCGDVWIAIVAAHQRGIGK